MSTAIRKMKRAQQRALQEPAKSEHEWRRERAMLCSAVGKVGERFWYRNLVKRVNQELERMGAGFALGQREDQQG